MADATSLLVPVTDGGTFPVRRLFCFAGNYRGGAGGPLLHVPKLAGSVVTTGGVVAAGDARGMAAGVALVVAIGRGGSQLRAFQALDHVWGYAVGIDLAPPAAAATGASLVNAAAAMPATVPALIGTIAPATAVGHPGAGAVALAVDGAVRQQADLADLAMGVADIVAHLSRFVRLEPGDLLYTGTPPGVAPAAPGDVLAATIAGLPGLTVTVGPAG